MASGRYRGPEFLNRIDEGIVFHKFQKREITEIVDVLLWRIRLRRLDHEALLRRHALAQGLRGGRAGGGLGARRALLRPGPGGAGAGPVSGWLRVPTTYVAGRRRPRGRVAGRARLNATRR